jgi:predicted tellurium resistance membrane protein TerC
MAMGDLFTVENLIALLTLTSLEVVLGIDNVVFIAILTGRLPKERQASARRIGLMLAMGMRILLLLSIKWIVGLTNPLFTLVGHEFSGRDLILGGGGLFLIAKSTFEIHHRVEGEQVVDPKKPARAVSFGSVLIQVMILDLVFSLDSVITAVGMAQHLAVMVVAVVIAVLIMMIFAGAVTSFIEKHPTIKMLALSFLLLIGVMLTAEAFHYHVDHAFIYFAMGFSLFVEVLNIRSGSRQHRAHGTGT